jgi:putative AdoMet-dependent methyltransferase
MEGHGSRAARSWNSRTSHQIDQGRCSDDYRGAVRSEHADTFNHDEDAAGYDVDVVDESNPIRAGYRATLDWVAERAAIRADETVLDLGVGTGNLAARLPGCRRLVGVDVSERMLEQANGKLGPTVELVQADLLEVLAGPSGAATDLDGSDNLDVIVSTYAIHHLTADEKETLIVAAAQRLAPGGRFVVGDLMAAGRATVPDVRTRLAHPDVDALFADEFPWYVDESLTAMAAAGFTALAAEQLSDLSWGLAARRR